ncbi:DsbA family protein [Saccharothrix deserti]|uniref:DsbA family protein n=1 Tax=Saccharothrix deserti TaxID=2593674 RepID=UPI00131D01AB|nr:thioredoxin domain-containing protein [Saccharothrix deserti]
MNDDQRRRRQSPDRTVAQARRSLDDRNRVVIGVVVVAVLALVVIGGVVWTGSSQDGGLTAPTGVTGINAPVERQDGVVIVGQDDAKATIDVYEDFLCPACARFEKAYGPRIKREVEAGALRVRYHLLPMLVGLSRPEGYSLDSANAALCAADQGKFWEYHEALFASQPREGGPGHTEQELVELGSDLGVTGEQFEQCVRTGRHEGVAKAELAEAKATDFFKGTPTVTVDDRPVDLSDSDWLQDVVEPGRAPVQPSPGG